MKRIVLAAVFLAVLATGLGLQAGLVDTRMATQIDQRNIARDVNYDDLGALEPFAGFYADNKLRISYGRGDARQGGGGPLRSLLKFTLPDAPDPVGPGQWIARSAVLSLYRKTSTGGTDALVHFAADDSWKGAKGTGTAADKVVWSTAPVIEATPLDSVPVYGAGPRYELDVLDVFAIHGELPGDTLTLLLRTQESGAPLAFFEDINYASQGQEPRLTVQYEWNSVPEPATLTMLGLGLAAISTRLRRRRSA